MWIRNLQIDNGNKQKVFFWNEILDDKKQLESNKLNT